MSDKNGFFDVQVRKGQIITTWGVGSIVPLSGGQSAMVSGLDQWDNNSPAFVVKDERLAKKLRVNGFRCPPPNIESGKTSDEINKTIPLYVFPTLYYCSVCGHVEYLKPYKKSSPRCGLHGPDEHPLMVPERFIVVCPEGHAMNIPVLEKIHQIHPEFDPKKWREDKQYRSENKIYRCSSRNTASLAGISYHLGKPNSDIYFSIDDLVRPGGLAGLYRDDHCPGEKPWLFPSENDACSIPSINKHENNSPCLRVVQRGGTNVWVSKTEKSIYIPEFALDGSANKYAEILKDKDNLAFLDNMASGGEEVLLVCCKQLVKGINGLTPEELLKQYKERTFRDENPLPEDEDDDVFRFTEYSVLTKTCGKDGDDLFVKSKPISEYAPVIRPYFESVSLVKSLKETLALVGFSRIDGSQEDVDSLKKRLAKKNLDWLPAVQTLGEGIFLKFREKKIEQWANEEANNRAEIIENNKQRSIMAGRKPEEITAPFVLVHTFAHAFINEISKVCGYGSSSIKERLYVSSDSNHKMYGVLIYTSGSGSDASLGGLVRQGQPGRLETLILKAIESISWCADDPVCISSKGQGPDGCNLAACHNCCLLPETCCETGNRFLDRAMLIGNPAFNKRFGYFDELFNGKEKENDEKDL